MVVEAKVRKSLPPARTSHMANHVCRSILLVLIGSAVCLVLGQESQNSSKTVWDGVYKSAQAERGREAFRTTCRGCHAADLSGGNLPLTGSTFLAHWLEDNLNSLFAKIRKMPPGGEGLPESTHLDILAFLLESNGYPAGQSDLSTTDLNAIRLTENQGASAVPNYATVETVGCLEQIDSGWILNRASEPMRNRNPDKPTEEELKRLTGQALGRHTFILLSPSSFAPGFRIEEHKGEKMAGKGLLIRTDSDERINVTWLETLSKSCP
jgi:S-disulfanyl-L-cysteine oxidoreductase SoxD